MKKPPAPTELMSPTEVAEHLGVRASTVRGYLARGQMPAPYVTLGSGPIWLRTEIERWAKERPRAGKSQEQADA